MTALAKGEVSGWRGNAGDRGIAKQPNRGVCDPGTNLTYDNMLYA
jgi:hypothetical protein